jgi:hydrogenase-4 component E
MHDCVWVLAFQSVILSITAIWMWRKTGASHLLIAAWLTFLVKAIIIPFILHVTIKKTGILRGVERLTSRFNALLLALSLSVAGFYLTARLHLPGAAYGEVFLPVSINLILLGTFIMIDHKKAIMQGVGLITIENGLFLIAESMGYGMPLMVELGIFFDLLITVVVIGILSFRMHSIFNSLSTEKMQHLKG